MDHQFSEQFDQLNRIIMSVESEEDRAVSGTRSRLIELEYLDPDKVLEDAINLLTRYNSLELLSAAIERKGSKEELIKLSGKFTITPPADQFEIFGSITIWIEKSFPAEAPHITFTQTNIPSSYFEPFLNTRQSTVIFSPYYNWSERKSTLLELIQCVTLNLRQVCLGWVLSARDQEEFNYIIPPRLSLPTGFPPIPIAPPNKPFDPSPIGGRPPYLNAHTIPPNPIHPIFPRSRQPLLPSPPRPFQHPNDPLSFRPPVSNDPLSFRPPVPNDPLSFRPPVPNDPLSFMPPVPNDPLSFMPPVPNMQPYFPQPIRQTSGPFQDTRNSYVSVVGPTRYLTPQSIIAPSQLPAPQIQTSLVGSASYPSQPPAPQTQTSPSPGLPQLHPPEIENSPPKTQKMPEAQNGLFLPSPSSPSQTNQNSDLTTPAPGVPITARKVKNM